MGNWKAMMMSVSKIWLVCDSVFGLLFGITMVQVMAQSRPFRSVVVSSASTLTAAVIGVVSGLVFLIGGALLGALYAKAKPVPGEFSPRSIVARVLVGAVIGGAVGATIFVPLMGVMGDLAVVFIDYHGVLLYFTGAIGGGIGAVMGAISSTPGLRLGIRIAAVLGAGVGGLVIGFVLGAVFIALFSAPFTRRIAS
jgi:hypothetical protein